MYVGKIFPRLGHLTFALTGRKRGREGTESGVPCRRGLGNSGKRITGQNCSRGVLRTEQTIALEYDEE